MTELVLASQISAPFGEACEEVAPGLVGAAGGRPSAAGLDGPRFVL